LSVALSVASDLADSLSDALIAAGALSVDTSDADAGTAWERPIFDEPGELPAHTWTRARVTALFSEDAEVSSVLAAALREAGAPEESAYEVTRVEDEDWVRRTQAQFVPQKITPGLWIVPSWHEPPDRQAVNIVLDPGLAFGTGTHPTTRLCLRWLAHEVRSGVSVLDVGCGSGILAIAALRLGADRACGVDIDPQAVEAATRNAARNGVNATFFAAAEHVRERTDIIVANILAQPLIVLAPLIASLNAEGGQLALSGILEAQADDVMDAYRDWYDFEPPACEDGWVLLSAVRR
jgi:ribosomal protein L11 methyltransferase